MIISCSRRTDIPAYYSDWFMNRVKEGFCQVPNPYNPKQVSTIDLSPGSVTAFVFWTRNPAPLIDRLDKLDQMGYRYYFLFTLNNYPRRTEPFRQNTGKATETFIRLSDRIGPSRVIWRYDPIILNEELTPEFHTGNFATLCRDLSGHTQKVITSFAEPYRKTVRRMSAKGLSLIDFHDKVQDYESVLKIISSLAGQGNIKPSICCSPVDYSHLNVGKAKCIDEELLRTEFDIDLKYRKDKSQRPNCNCHESRDIGINNTCLAGCLYCYATSSQESAVKNRQKHNRTCSSLIPNCFI